MTANQNVIGARPRIPQFPAYFCSSDGTVCCQRDVTRPATTYDEAPTFIQDGQVFVVLDTGERYKVGARVYRKCTTRRLADVMYAAWGVRLGPPKGKIGFVDGNPLNVSISNLYDMGEAVEAADAVIAHSADPERKPKQFVDGLPQDNPMHEIPVMPELARNR